MLVLVASSVQAQGWTEIGKFPGVGVCCYFWDAQSGIVAISSTDDANPPANSSMYKTLNGGRTWTSITLPSGIVGHGFILSIYMRDRMNGWFTFWANDFPYTTPGVYQTTDGGITWVVDTSAPPFGPNPGSTEYADIYQLKNGNMVYSCGGITPISDSICIIGNNTDVSTYTIPDFFLTTDEGNSWKDIGLIPFAVWGLSYLPSCGRIFGYSGDVFYSQQPYHLYYSSDTGKTWNNGAAPEPLNAMTGDVEGEGNAIYIQSDALGGGDNSGLWRSTDSGNSWKSIGGPALENFTRFCLPKSCNGGVVIALDATGGVWETTDGGDGLLPESQNNTTLSLGPVPQTKACNESKLFAIISSNTCPNGFTLTNDSLEGDTIHFTLDSLGSLPLSFGGGTHDSIFVNFNPNKEEGNFSTKLHVTGVINMPDTSLPFDTTVNLLAYSLPVSPELIPSAYLLDFGGVSTCNSVGDSSVTFTNTGCAADTITSLTLTGAGFTGVHDSLPIVVLPDSSVTFPYRFFRRIRECLSGKAPECGFDGVDGKSVGGFVGAGCAGIWRVGREQRRTASGKLSLSARAIRRLQTPSPTPAATR